jgi:8-oxo-dGTP pyrophosphatase MutT (NUDIX family)
MSEIIISNDQAKQDKLFYVVANMAIVDVKKAKVLILKRGDSEKVHPGKWAFPGGKLEHADVIKLLEKTGNAPIQGVDNILGKLAQREAKEECGLDVNAAATKILSDKVFVRPDEVPVFMTVLATEYVGGEVQLEAGAFSDHAWVGIDDLTRYDLIDGLQNEVRLAIKMANIDQ